MHWLYPSQLRLMITEFFFRIKYSKRQEIKMVTLLCHTVTQGVFHQYHFENIFDSAKNFTAGDPNPLLHLQTFRCRLSKKKHPGQSKKLIYVTP